MSLFIDFSVGLVVMTKVACVEEIVFYRAFMRGETLDMVWSDEPGGFVLGGHGLLDCFEVVVGWQVNCVRGCDVVVY